MNSALCRQTRIPFICLLSFLSVFASSFDFSCFYGAHGWPRRPLPAPASPVVRRDGVAKTKPATPSRLQAPRVVTTPTRTSSTAVPRPRLHYQRPCREAEPGATVPNAASYKASGDNRASDSEATVDVLRDEAGQTKERSEEHPSNDQRPPSPTPLATSAVAAVNSSSVVDKITAAVAAASSGGAYLQTEATRDAEAATITAAPSTAAQHEKRKDRRRSLAAPQYRRSSLSGPPLAHKSHYGGSGATTQASQPEIVSTAAAAAAAGIGTQRTSRSQSRSPPRPRAVSNDAPVSTSGNSVKQTAEAAVARSPPKPKSKGLVNGSPAAMGAATSVQPPAATAASATGERNDSNIPPQARRHSPPRYGWQSSRNSMSPEHGQLRRRFGSPGDRGLTGTRRDTKLAQSSRLSREDTISDPKPLVPEVAADKPSSDGGGSARTLSPPACGTGRVPIRMGADGRRKRLTFSPSSMDRDAGLPVVTPAADAVHGPVEAASQRRSAAVAPATTTSATVAPVAPREPPRSSTHKRSFVQSHNSGTVESSCSSDDGRRAPVAMVDQRRLLTAEVTAETLPSKETQSAEKCSQSAPKTSSIGAGSERLCRAGGDAGFLEALPLPDQAADVELSPGRDDTGADAPFPGLPLGGCSIDVAVEIADEERRPEMDTERYAKRCAERYGVNGLACTPSSNPPSRPEVESTKTANENNEDASSRAPSFPSLSPKNETPCLMKEEGTTGESTKQSEEVPADEAPEGRSTDAADDEDQSKRQSGAFVQGRNRRRGRMTAALAAGETFVEAKELRGDDRETGSFDGDRSLDSSPLPFSPSSSSPVALAAVGDASRVLPSSTAPTEISHIAGKIPIEISQISGESEDDDDDDDEDDSGESGESGFETGSESESESESGSEGESDLSEEDENLGTSMSRVPQRQQCDGSSPAARGGMCSIRERSGLWGDKRERERYLESRTDDDGDGDGTIVLDPDLPQSSDGSDAASQYSTPCSTSRSSLDEVGNICFSCFYYPGWLHSLRLLLLLLLL